MCFGIEWRKELEDSSHKLFIFPIN